MADRDEGSTFFDDHDSDLVSLPLERLEHEITELAAHINAATCRWLLLVAELDRREGWASWGCRSCAQWLSWRCGLAPRAAREQLRVARRLAEMPHVRKAFWQGQLSYSKVRAISRVATSENESNLLELALHATAAQLERLVRSYRGVLATQVEEVNRAHAERHLVWSWDDDGSLVIHGRLPAEDGQLFLRALEAARDELRERGRPAEPAGGGSAEPFPSAGSPERGSAEPSAAPAGEPPATREPASANNADGLALMAETLLAGEPAQRPAGERYQVVLHVDADVLSADASDGRCELEDGPAVPAETARRLACDTSLLSILEHDGRPLSVGRKRRSIPPALRRALHARDGGCRFPGCTQRRFVDAHHIEHWAHGGETKLSNLLLLCRHHHRLLHEGGYQVERRAGRGVRFRRPDGKSIPIAPMPRRGDHRRLSQGNRSAGLTITSNTPVALSAGDRLDYGMAVEGLLARDGLLLTGPVGTT